MNLLNHLSEQLSPLRPTDTIEAAIDWMTNQKVSNLPIVEAGKVHGYAILENLLFCENKRLELRDVVPKDISYPILNKRLVIWDSIPIFLQTGFETLAVCKEDYNYAGILEKNKVFRIMANMLSVNMPGAIIVLKIGSRDYSPTELCRLAENEGCKPVGIWISSNENDSFEVNIKLQPGKIRNVVATYERFGYQIVDVFNPDDSDEDNDNRYKVFMKFLDF